MSLEYIQPSTLGAVLRCGWPRCGVGRLFSGFLNLARSCEHCGLDFGFADPADGPAFFAITIVGTMLVGVWAWTTVTWRPPIWLQFTVFVPALTLGSLGALRPLKAWFVAEQYARQAGESQ